MVEQVHSPGQFWFNIHGPGHFHTVTEMMDTMDKFYNSFLGNSYKIRNSSLLTPGNTLFSLIKTDNTRLSLVDKVNAEFLLVRECHCRQIQDGWLPQS